MLGRALISLSRISNVMGERGSLFVGLTRRRPSNALPTIKNLVVSTILPDLCKWDIPDKYKAIELAEIFLIDKKAMKFSNCSTGTGYVFANWYSCLNC